MNITTPIGTITDLDKQQGAVITATVAGSIAAIAGKHIKLSPMALFILSVLVAAVAYNLSK